MAGTSLALAVCLVLLCRIWETAAFEARITKPIDCDRDEVRFHRGHQYLYHYSTAVETTFVGTTVSKSAFKLECEVVVEARRKCEAYMNVTLCSLYHRQPGEGDVYTKDITLSADITLLLGRELYFQFDRGTIRPHTIVVDSVETSDALNIKRGILSALQIKLVTDEPGDQIYTMETEDLFGSCPTEYIVDTPGVVRTSRDITKCQVPHYSYRQQNLFSMIKRVYGGYLHGVIDELIYPFNSTIKCEHLLGENHRLEETKCLQQQQFRPFAREGTIVATCMANISQHLILEDTRDLLESNVNRKMRGKKSGSLTYEFDVRGESIQVTKEDISHWMQTLTIHNGTMETTPKLFHHFLWFLRQAQTNDLWDVMADVWNCHGIHENYCNKKIQMLEQDFLLDGLLACGTDACISVFTQAMRAGHVSRWREYMFIYDLALYHDSSTEVATSMLEMCIERRSASCWFPFSIMVNTIANAGGSAVALESGPVYQTLHHVRETMGDTCRSGISQTLTQIEQQNSVDELLLMIKVLGNIGAPVQYVYDSRHTGMEGESGDQRLVHALLQCAHNTNLPHKVSKSAILALHKMAFTPEMKDALVGILVDVNRPPSLRTTVFARLAMQPDRELAAGLHELVYTETMAYMKNYMITYVKSLLQNDQPDLQHLRNIWEELIDSRAFPYSSHRMGKSKYIEMSRYIKFPLSVDYYGFQIELDTVYNVASPVVNAVVLRVNYFADHTVNLLEFSADIDDFNVLVDAISQDITILQKYFPIPNGQGEFDPPRDQTVFATLQENIVAAILELFDEMNLSEENIPDGIIYVKVLGQELFFLEVRDFMMAILHRMPTEHIVMGYLHALLQQLPLHRTSSTSVLDVVKVLPTVGGFPLNMTVSVAMSMALDFDASLTMPDILKLITDIQLDTTVKARTAVHFNGELTTRFGQHSLSGARASSSGLVQVSVSPSCRFNTRPDPPRKAEISLSQTNTDSTYTVARLSGHMYLLHPSGEEEVEGDPEFQTTVQDCDRGFLTVATGNQVCFTSVYPNTTSSTSHAYFPLSGPFHFSLDTRKVETNTFHLSFVRDMDDIDDHIWINLTRQGQENTDGLILHAHKKDKLRLVELLIPTAQIHFYAKDDYTSFYDPSTKSTYFWVCDAHLSAAGTSLYRFLVQVQRETRYKPVGVLTSRKIVDVTLAIPGTSLAVTVNSFKNRSNGYYNTTCNITYHCIKARPMLYLLHWNPTLAKQNGDVSEAQVVNTAIIGYNNDNSIWSANDYMQLKLPGLQISLDNRMEANVTYANRQTVIVYTGISGQEHTVTMNAHVTNGTNSTYNNYDYYMMLYHSGMPYNLSLRGHLKGTRQNLNVVTEIEHVSKIVQDIPTVGEINLFDVEDGMTGTIGGENVGSPETEPCKDIPGRTLVALTFVGVPVPDGIEMRWDYNYTRQVCGGQVQYRTTGVYGRQPINTRRNFHHWVTVNATVTKSRDAVGQQESVVRSKTYRANCRLHFKKYEVIHVVLGYSSQLANASYILHILDRPSPSLLLNYQLQTPWPAVNFNVRHLYIITDHLLHETEVTSAWLDISTVARYYFSWFKIVRINFDSYIDSRLPWLPGTTNITGQFEMSDDILPQMLVVLERSDGTIELKADMINTTLNIFTLTFQKPDEEVMHLLTWKMALRSTRASTHTLIWNPDLVQVVNRDGLGRFSQLRLAMIEAGEVALLNAHKPVSLMVIPFTDMTVGVLLEAYLYPYVRLPVIPGSLYDGDNSPITPDQTGSEGDDDSGTTPQHKPSFGNLALGLLSRTVGSTLTAVGGVSVQSPWLVKRLFDRLLRPTIEQILADSRVTFTGPLLGQWHSFLASPTKTYGLYYLEGVFRRVSSGVNLRRFSEYGNTVRAFVINRQYLVTYYGRIYHIPDDQAADCVHLLAADFKRETFAVLLSRQGITVVTSEMSVTLEFGGNVFRDNCPRPVRLPFGRKGSRIRVYMENEDMILDTSYGVLISCRLQREVCSIVVSGQQFSHSWGLLGTNDGDPGSDFQLPSKYITPDTNTFIQSYAVGGPPKCVSPEYHQETLAEPLHPHPPIHDNLQTRCSTEMADECNRQFTKAIESSTCDSLVSPQQFLDSCLSEARGCGRGASDACKHIKAYEYACHLKIAWDVIFVNCALPTTRNDEGSRRPVDVVVVVSDILESSRSDVEAHVETLLHSVKYDLRNVQLGIIGYGGDIQIVDALDPTLSTRYMVTLNSLDVAAANSPWRTAWKRFPNVDTMNEALDMAASYPFRLNTQKVVIVLSREENPYISDDVKSKYQNRNIIVNSFGVYESVDVSNKVNGINWDSTVIYRDWSSTYRILPLPESRLVELVAATKGAVFHADSVTEGRKKRLRFVIKHIKEQIKLNNVC